MEATLKRGRWRLMSRSSWSSAAISLGECSHSMRCVSWRMRDSLPRDAPRKYPSSRARRRFDLPT